MTKDTCVVIVNGKPEVRPVDHIQFDRDLSRDHRWPEYFPVLYEGEKLVRTMSGQMIIVREYE